jgi:hypothetical protein
MNIEPLESRIAPAAIFVNGTTATYTDVDGDLVTVKFSKVVLTELNGSVVLLTSAVGALGAEQLRTIDLPAAANAAGTNISVSAKPQDANDDTFMDGDGLANVGGRLARPASRSKM